MEIILVILFNIQLINPAVQNASGPLMQVKFWGTYVKQLIWRTLSYVWSLIMGELTAEERWKHTSHTPYSPLQHQTWAQYVLQTVTLDSRPKKKLSLMCIKHTSTNLIWHRDFWMFQPYAFVCSRNVFISRCFIYDPWGGATEIDASLHF